MTTRTLTKTRKAVPVIVGATVAVCDLVSATDRPAAVRTGCASHPEAGPLVLDRRCADPLCTSPHPAPITGGIKIGWELAETVRAQSVPASTEFSPSPAGERAYLPSGSVYYLTPSTENVEPYWRMFCTLDTEGPQVGEFAVKSARKTFELSAQVIGGSRVVVMREITEALRPVPEIAE